LPRCRSIIYDTVPSKQFIAQNCEERPGKMGPDLCGSGLAPIFGGPRVDSWRRTEYHS